MARIGVVSIYDMNNVGNRLQSFALCTALEQLGHTPVVIPNTPYSHRVDQEWDDDPGTGTSADRPESVVRMAWRLLVSGDWWGLGDKARRALVLTMRVRALGRFTRRHQRIDPRSITGPGDGSAFADEYDTFVVGSDQVWNPRYRFGNPTDFLRFARPEQRVAYAASFGVAELPEDYVAHYRAMLTGFASVSVREHSGARLVHDLVGRRVEVTLDPTMLVPVEEWHRLADRAEGRPSEPFLGTYILWNSDRETQRGIRSLATSRGWRARELMAPGLHHPDFYGVENFLRTIRDAEAVVTDSFHSTLFAILFRTPVRVLSRGPGQDDRIESLLEIFGVPVSEAFGAADDAPAAPLVDDPEALLAPVRERSRTWLRDAVAETP